MCPKLLDGVEPIVQRDRGGELWGRIKLRHQADLEKVLKACFESRGRLKVAIQEGRATAWWAMSRTQRTLG